MSAKFVQYAPTTSQNGNSTAERLPRFAHSSWWESFKSRFKWERLTVSGKIIEKGLVLTPTMVLTIILTVGGMITGGLGTIYWRLSDRVEQQGKTFQDTHDLLIRVDQKLTDNNDHAKEKLQEFKETFEKAQQNEDAMWKVNEKRMAKLEGARN